MSELTALEYGHEIVANLDPDLVLASSPGNFCEPELAERVQSLGVSVENIIDFAADIHNVDPAELSAMAIYMVSKASNGGNRGRMDMCPQVLNQNQVYYPTIRLTVDDNPKIDGLNRTLRHEIRHVFQNIKPSFDCRPRVVRTMQVLGGMAAAGLAARGCQLDYPNVVGLAAMGTEAVAMGSLALPNMAELLAWGVSPKEWDAEYFSYRHRTFKPIVENA